MLVDLAALVVVALAVLRGWWRGLLAQLFGLAGLVALLLVVPRMVGPIRAWLLAHGQSAGLGLEVSCLAIAVGSVLGATWLASTIIPDAVRSWSESAGQADRALGAALGGVRGVLAAALLLLTVAWAERPLTERIPALREPLRTSHVVAAARNWNVWRLVDPERLDDLRRALASGAQATADASPLALSIFADPGLQHAARVGDRRTLLADPRVVAALVDGSLEEEVDAILDEEPPRQAPEQRP